MYDYENNFGHECIATLVNAWKTSGKILSASWRVTQQKWIPCLKEIPNCGTEKIKGRNQVFHPFFAVFAVAVNIP
jgi:hypothetical protein